MTEDKEHYARGPAGRPQPKTGLPWWAWIVAWPCLMAWGGLAQAEEPAVEGEPEVEQRDDGLAADDEAEAAATAEEAEAPADEASAAEEEPEELTVTGSYIKQAADDAAMSVTTLDRDMLDLQGSPSMVDIFKNLSSSHGVIGEANSWYGTGQNLIESVANVNLRGLGASRTLVLLNGRRQVYVPARLTGGRFADVNAFPAIAIDRLEVLKEGAAVVYGSDAMGGVVNFLTRKDFEGFQLDAAHDYFDDAGDTTLSAIWGGPVGAEAHAMVAVEHYRRQELNLSDRDWGLRAFGDGGGWSGIGNPGAFVRYDGSTETRKVDPQCEAFGGSAAADGSTCRFRYGLYDNLIEDQYHTRVFAELNGVFDGGMGYHLETLYAEAVIPDWYTTPSFPPAAWANSDRVQMIGSGHPAYDDVVSLLGSGGDEYGFVGRLVGNSGPGRTVRRDSETWRFAASVDDELDLFEETYEFDLGFTYSHSEGNVAQPGELIYRRFLAYRGFGGPNCGVYAVPDATHPSGLQVHNPGGKTAGQGGCMYYNPHSDALRRSEQPGAPYRDADNPDYDPSKANSPELIAWINEKANLKSEADLYVFDATISGEVGEDLGSFAAGYQFRRFEAEATPNFVSDLGANPCRVNIGQVPQAVRDAAGLTAADFECDENQRTGMFTFIGGNKSYKVHQTTHAVFGEWAVPLGDFWEAQVAAHYEEHEESGTFDPKFALRWDAADWLTLRGVVQTTFRAPSVDDLNEDPVSTQQWIAGTYKPVEIIGNKNLDPEEALTYNLGMMMDFDSGASLSLDYWRYDIDDSITALPYQTLINAYGRGGSDKQAVQDLIFFAGGKTGANCTTNCTTNDIERVQTPLVNGPTLKTSGIDFNLNGRHDMGVGTMMWGVGGTYLLEYDIDALTYNGTQLRGKIKGAGFYNEPFDFTVPPLPRLKARGYAGYHWGNFSLNGYLNYTSEYDDRSAPIQYREIDSFVTLDLGFQWTIGDGGTTLIANIYNIADEDPPFAYFESSYDNLTHDSKGRRFKLTFRHDFSI